MVNRTDNLGFELFLGIFMPFWYIFFSQAFSASSSFNRFMFDTSMPPYLARLLRENSSSYRDYFPGRLQNGSKPTRILCCLNPTRYIEFVRLVTDAQLIVQWRFFERDLLPCLINSRAEF